MSNSTYVQKILNDIKTDIVRGKKTCNYIDFEEYWLIEHQAYDTDFSKIELISDVAALENSYKIDYCTELSSYKKGLSFIVISIKKIIKKALTFIMIPMTEQQNRVNFHNMRIGQHMRSFINSQEKITRNIEVLNNETLVNAYNIEKINEQIAAMSAEIENLRKENSELRALKGGDDTI